MSNLIKLAAVQKNIIFTGTPAVQDWYISQDPVTITYYQGSAMPAALTLLTKFKDVFGTSLAGGYSALKYRTYTWNSHSVNCVVMSGPLFTGSTGMNTITAQGIQGNMTYTFQNLNVLSPGVYTFKAEHIIYGISALTGSYETITQKTLVITINVLPAGAPAITPLSVITSRSSTAGNVNTVVSPSFEVSGTSPWALECPAGSTFQPVAGVTLLENGSGGYVASGTGTKVLTLLLTPAIIPNPLPANNQVVFNLVLKPTNQSIPVTVLITNATGFYQSLNELHYAADKGVTEAAPRAVQMNYANGFYIECPSWVTASVTSGTGAIEVYFSVLPTTSIASGDYLGTIVIRAENGNSIISTIAVTYFINERIRNPYNNRLGFTLENKTLPFVGDADTYYELELQTRAYDFFAGTFKEYSSKFKIPLFKGAQSFSIGQVVHRLMARYPDYTTEALYPYRHANVNVVSTKRKFSDALFTNSETFAIYFVAGPRPENVYEDCAFLDINTGASRVTPKGFAYVNMNLAYAMVKVFVNEEEISRKYYDTSVTTIKQYFSQYNPGDVIEYRILINEFTLSKKFIVFPEGYNSLMVVWENEFLLRQALEFTGKYSLKADFENRTQALAVDFTDVLSKIESVKTNTLTLNTGFILKSDTATVESLCRSRRAALLLPGGKIINLVPMQKTITAFDDDLATISYDIEFQINRQTNEEVYSF